MKRELFFGLLIVFSLLVAGCTDVSNLMSPLNDLFDTNKAYGASNKGVEPVFVIPRARTYISKSLPFSPRIKLLNHGDLDARGQICLAGLDREIFKGFSGCDCEQFNIYWEDGEMTAPDVVFGPYTVSGANPDDEQFVTALVRYTTSTEAEVQMCLSKDVYNLDRCRARILSEKEGPLAIVSVDEFLTPLTDKNVAITFNIHLKKSPSGGELWDPYKVYEPCQMSSDKLNKVIETRLDNVPFVGSVICDELKVEGDQSDYVVKCDIPDLSLYSNTGYAFENYSPKIKIKISYAYQDIISSNFKIR